MYISVTIQNVTFVGRLIHKNENLILSAYVNWTHFTSYCCSKVLQLKNYMQACQRFQYVGYHFECNLSPT